MKFEDLRAILVKDLIKNNISSENILNAFSKVAREEFVPTELHRYSYENMALNIGAGQTISQPFIQAWMLQLLDIQSNDLVLEIGTGSGYQTALIAEISKEVYTVERIDQLSRNARKVLKKLNYQNIHFRVGDGTKGWEKAYPACSSFDKIIVCAGSPEVPQILLDQLKIGGKLVIPCGGKDDQNLVYITKTETGIEKEFYGGCSFVPLIGEQGWED